MSNTDRFTEPSSFDQSEPGVPWPEGVTPPGLDDPLYLAYSAAKFGYELNGLYWRFNDDGIPEPVIN